MRGKEIFNMSEVFNNNEFTSEPSQQSSNSYPYSFEQPFDAQQQPFAAQPQPSAPVPEQKKKSGKAGKIVALLLACALVGGGSGFGAISDSTLYPLFYTISLYSNTKQITPEQMTPEFFDYVVLEKGEPSAVAGSTGIDQELLEKIRKDVHYWYPLDINLGGKEHMTVHFPVFLMNHRAILPDDMQPKGIIVNWYVTGKNKDKISKSKGGAQPIPGYPTDRNNGQSSRQSHRQALRPQE